MSVKVVGHVDLNNPIQENAYVLDDGRTVTFHTARDSNGSISILYAELGTWPSIVASRLGVQYSFMRNATPEEVQVAVNNKKLTIQKVIKV